MFILPINEDRPPKSFPLVNCLLIGINFYVFFKTYFSPSFELDVFHYGFVPAHAQFRTVLTSMFMHAGIGHILGNMYFLYVFGNSVEDRMGKIGYLFGYLLSGFGAAYLQYYIQPHSHIPLIGASGAISGICALYMLMFPLNKMRLQFFFFIFPLFSIPAHAFLVVGVWFAEQYFMATLSDPRLGGVAFWAHVGGFLTGILLFPFFYSEKKKT